MSIKTITSDDIKNVNEFMKSDEMTPRLPQGFDNKDFYGVLSERPEQSYILPGHVKPTM